MTPVEDPWDPPRSATATGHRDRIDELAAIERELIAELDRDRLLPLVLRRVAGLFGAAASGHLLRGDRLLPWQQTEAEAVRVELAIGEGVTGRSVQRRAGLLVNDYAAWSGAVPAAVTRGLRHVMSQPLLVRDELIGAITVARLQQDAPPFTDEDLAVLGLVAARVALALRNATLYEEAQARRHEAEVAARIARTLNSSLEVDVVLQRVVEAARELCGSDIARIALLDPASGAMVFRYWVNSRYRGYGAIRLTADFGLGGRVIATRRPLRTDDWARDPRFSKETLPVIQAEGIVTQMAVPIRTGEHVEGLLYVDNRTARPFTDRDEAVLVGLADHAAIAIRNAQLFTTAQQTTTRLQALSAKLIEVQEAERRHIARELHDEVGQALTAIRINLLMLRRGGDAAAVSARIDDALLIVERLLGSVRQLSLDLRPSLLDDLGLAAALRWYVDGQAQRAGLLARVSIDALAHEPAPELAITCFRVAQEAVTNAVRHAAAKRIELELRERGGALELVVRDDGSGFDVAAARARAARGESLGLLGLQERVELAGGHASIESSPAGTEVRAQFPWPPPAPGAARS